MKGLKETIAAFDKGSEEYDSWYGGSKGKAIFKSELLAVKALLPKGRGIEIGVGTGVFASELDIEFGLDPSIACLRLARERGVKVVCGIGEALPFKDGSFDFALYAVTLCFLADPKAALREAQRVLKPMGKIVVCFIPGDSPWGKFYLEKKVAGHRFYKHANFYSPEEVDEMLRKAGFILKAQACTLLQQPGAEIIKVEKPSMEKCKLAGFHCIKAEKVG
jgi:ubiquinone/menaquinone biosynthesis C-methylase UbiE